MQQDAEIQHFGCSGCKNYSFGSYVTLKCIQMECIHLTLNYDINFGFYLQSLS
jgi:hypothetical protein